MPSKELSQSMMSTVSIPSNDFRSTVIQITPTKMAVTLLVVSAAFTCLAKFFYSYYRLIFGTLYPSYASYKTIKSRDAASYPRWMMYWVCYGLFNAVECFTDVFLGFWFPFYYELKILFILWLVSGKAHGAHLLYKCFIHPELQRHEQEIDQRIEKVTKIGVDSFYTIGSHFAELSMKLVNDLARSIISRLTYGHGATDQQLNITGGNLSLQTLLTSFLGPNATTDSTDSSHNRQVQALKGSSTLKSYDVIEIDDLMDHDDSDVPHYDENTNMLNSQSSIETEENAGVKPKKRGRPKKNTSPKVTRRTRAKSKSRMHDDDEFSPSNYDLH